MEEDEYVEVVYPLEQIKGIIGLICFGIVLGIVTGIGLCYPAMHELAERKMEIHGAVSITHNENDDPIYIGGITIKDAEIGISMNCPKTSIIGDGKFQE